MEQLKRRLGALHELLAVAEFTILRLAIFLATSYAVWKWLSGSGL